MRSIVTGMFLAAALAGACAHDDGGRASTTTLTSSAAAATRRARTEGGTLAPMATSLDEALEDLYRATPEAFTAKRDALAKRLKDEGDADAAGAVKARRKPTQIAYVLNQLARRHPGEL